MNAGLTNVHQLRERAEQSGQGHIFNWWNELDEPSQKELLNQVHSLDFDLVNELIHTLVTTVPSPLRLELEPAPILPIPGTAHEKARMREAKELGETKISEGKVAVLVVAGGQGTRLGYPGPKGAFPIGPISGKCLFQFFAERIIRNRRRYGRPIPWYIMTSPDNHDTTYSFFKDRRYFGIPEGDVFFFSQGTLPAVDHNGKIILEAKGRIFLSPDGHGGTLRALNASGALADMITRGIKEISYFQVDNILAKVLDPVFIGYHCKENADISSKVVRKSYPEERVGIIGIQNKRLGVVEYSDLAKEDMYATNSDGSLKYWAGSIAIHLLHVHFVEELTRHGIRLPFHRAEKEIPYVDVSGAVQQPQYPNGIKFESFIFDALGYAQRSVTMEVIRSEEFSPIKNATGVDSPETARRDFSHLHASWLEQTGVRVPRNKDGTLAVRIEISPLFALDTEDLSSRLSPDLEITGDLLLEDESVVH
jgi:UDP-N-acetylglucosamine/UDP-N-acetylgalactosamine diphosphorylase